MSGYSFQSWDLFSSASIRLNPETSILSALTKEKGKNVLRPEQANQLIIRILRLEKSGGPGRNRTCDQVIMSHLL